MDQQNKIVLLPKGQYQVEKDASYPYISFIPMTDDVELSLSGFKYNLTRQMLNIGSTLTISNEVGNAQAMINVHEGLLLQIRSADLKE